MNLNKAIQSAFEHHQQGDLKQAKYLYEKILKKQPDNTDVLHMLGVIHSEHGNYELAIKYIKKALQLNSTDYHAYYNLGNAFRLNGQSEEAVNIYQKVIKINPYFADAYHNLGIVLRGNGQLDEAITCYQKAIQLNPNFYYSHYNLGDIFQEKGQFDEAITCYQKAIQLNADFAAGYCSLGKVFQDKERLDEAITCYRKAIELNPDIAGAYNNLGIILHNKGQIDEAMTLYQKALKLNPRDALAHMNIALILLLRGDFKEGWKEYEWRWKLKDFINREFSQPLWDGSDISGKTLLLHTEQGLGDAIQFIRYVPLVVRKGVTIVVECQQQLIPLFQNIKNVRQIIAQGEQLPSFDIHCPILNLPLVSGTTIDTIPAEIPYLKGNATLLRKWENKVEDNNSKFKVGLAWAGSPAHKNDRKRSFLLATFAPLANFNNIIFYSLQKGKGSEQAKAPPDGMNLIDYTDEIHDFSDTAAFIENLDLVISADTAVAHLAGALGKPVWTLLPFVPDWRWMLNREDSPWYPTMRLFRQPSIDDWKSVIVKVANELENKIKGIVPEAHSFS